MALVQCKFMRFTSVLSRVSVRSFSKNSKILEKECDVKKSVFISQSNDVYTNLALEDWIYKNFDLKKHHVLMLWQNNPSVTIGCNQNPWIETNVNGLGTIADTSVQLARRKSGGESTYNDLGNLNMTFFTPISCHNKRYNLELIRRALFREYGTKTTISSSEDLTVRNYKVSSTAAKLGDSNSYHHCTLLIDVNQDDLREALHKKESGILTNATKSSRNTKVMNLCDENPKITVDGLLAAIGWEFMRTPAYTLKDGGMELANKQKGFQMINPTDKWFPGINEIRDDLMNWEWCYDKTPKFTISRSFPVPMKYLNMSDPFCEDLKITMTVHSGRIEDVSLYVPPGLSTSGLSGDVNVITNLKGHKFTEEALNSLESSLSGNLIHNEEKEKFVTDCVRQVMISI